MRATLAAVTAPEWTAASRAVCHVILRSPQFAGAKAVLAFMPIEGELDITPVLEQALVQGKRLCLPRIDWASRNMVAAEVDALNDTQLESTRHAIRQPKPDRKSLHADEIDLVLVPGLAFARWPGNGRGFARLGRGAGFYDRFLGEMGKARTRNPRHETIGIALAAQVVAAVPVDAWDEPISNVATPDRMLANV